MGKDFHHFDDLRDWGINLEDILQGFGFGGDIFGGAFGGTSSRYGPGRGRDLEYRIEISFEDAAFGGKKTIAIPRYESCEACAGTGAKPGSKQEKCQACGGRGQVSSSNGFFNMVRTCSKCGGEGVVIKTPCQACAGRGRVKAKKEIDVNIPAGVDNGSRLRLQGQGEAGERGGRRGDLYLAIHVKDHEIFERHDSDIYCDVPVDFATATLGGEVEVPTLEGKVKLKIPAGTQGGKIMRLRGRGVAHLHDRGIGDQLVKIEIDIPTDLTAEQKKLLKEFQKASCQHPGPLEQSFVEKMRRMFK
jgi:molecular chaperone DnaJ